MFYIFTKRVLFLQTSICIYFLGPSETVSEVKEPAESSLVKAEFCSPAISSSTLTSPLTEAERSSFYMETFNLRHERGNLKAELNLQTVKSLLWQSFNFNKEKSTVHWFRVHNA